VVSPDVYVVKGVEQRQRDIYKVWEEGGHGPCFVLEITSKSSRHTDLGEKMSRYRYDLEVPEYFLFDPRSEWIPEAVRGFALDEPGVYKPLERDDRDRLVSQQLGLSLGVADGHLRFYLPGADAPLPTRAERAARAEAEVERLKAELERLRGGPE
jgi:Uma2 family endonuclease